MLDLLLGNARIVDGTGNPWRKGCVGVRDGRIVAVGSGPTTCPKPGRCSTSEATSCAPASSTATAIRI